MKKNNRIRYISVLAVLSVLFLLIPAYSVRAEEKDYRIYDADFDDKTETEGKIYGYWTPAEDKTTYTLTLYKGDTKIGTKQCSASGRADLSAWISSKRGGSGTYTFRVFPTKGGEDMTIVSESFEVTATMVSAISKYSLQERKDAIAAAGGGWVRGPGDIWIYYASDGNQVKANWVEYNGRKYYLDKSGIMVTGWQAIGSAYYYFEPKGTADNPLGALWVNTVTPDGKQVSGDGARIDEKGEIVQPQTYKTLTVVSVSLKESQEPGKLTQITDIICGSGKVSDIEYKTDPAAWTTESTGIVSFKITLLEGYLLKKDFKVSCSRAVSTKIMSYNSSEICVELLYTPKYVLMTPENFYITDSNVLYWDKVDRAKEYTVKITTSEEEEAEDGTVSTKSNVITVNTSNNWTDLGSNGVEEDTAVKSITVTASGSDTKRYIVSSAGKIEDFEKLKAERRLNGTFEVTAVGWRYKDESGNMATGWKELLGNWYYFKGNGYAATGWYRDSTTDYWYYFDERGRMQTGTVTLPDGTYSLNDGTRTDLPLGAWITR